ncbi:MAG TPA: hypothetical protein VFM05_15305 [Candidatus Saccharimonadales bacterium]|nr:hypothetical protein [Candidatus Saccharimonadales bacterium]
MSKHKKSNIYFIALGGCIAAILIFSLWFVAQSHIYAQENTDQLEVGIPFEKVSETFRVSVGRPWWFVVLVLPPEQYSKDNLERIFQYYKEKHSDKREALTVDVFAGMENFKRFKEDPPSLVNVFSDTPPEPLTKDNWKAPHASFLRACENEFYYYSPDLEEPNKTERVLLKGGWTAGPELSECR